MMIIGMMNKDNNNHKHEPSGEECLANHEDGIQCERCKICGVWFRNRS